MKKELFNILILGGVVVLVIGASLWVYWTLNKSAQSGWMRAEQNHVLAISWQPAFCEQKPNKPECRSQHKGRFDTRNFSLHGLWPQPRSNVYCGVSGSIKETDKRGRWQDLPRLELANELRQRLGVQMPGYRSNLYRHEWVKHGTCMGNNISPQQYFDMSLEALEAVNKSQLKELFTQNIGKEVTSRQIIKALENSFGSQAGERVTIACKRDGRRTLISELRISMITASDDASLLADNNWILDAPELPIGCKRGIVDPVGLQ